MKTYNPKNIVISLGTLLINRGFPEESMVKVTQIAAVWEDVVGVDGEVTRVRIHDGRATVTISLMQSSDANNALSALLLRDMASPNGAGVGAFLMQDLGGSTLVKASEAWVKGKPEQEFGKKVNARAWEFTLANNDQTFIGGAASTL